MLIPERGLHAERYAILIKRAADFLVGQTIDVQSGDPLGRLRFQGNDGQVPVLDLIAVQYFSVTHRPASRSCLVSSIPPYRRNQVRVLDSAMIFSTRPAN